MIQLINLPRLDIIPYILPFIRKRALDVKHEFPMRPLGREWGRETVIIPGCGELGERSLMLPFQNNGPTCVSLFPFSPHQNSAGNV
jgi:hypothetical protein